MDRPISVGPHVTASTSTAPRPFIGDCSDEYKQGWHGPSPVHTGRHLGMGTPVTVARRPQPPKLPSPRPGLSTILVMVQCHLSFDASPATGLIRPGPDTKWTWISTTPALQKIGASIRADGLSSVVIVGVCGSQPKTPSRVHLVVATVVWLHTSNLNMTRTPTMAVRTREAIRVR